MVSPNLIFDFRGKPNPCKDLLIPENALSWNKDVYRPESFPEDYDIRIHPSAIFALPQPGLAQDSRPVTLITHFPCDRCAGRDIIKYMCSRQWPCSHCTDNGCIYTNYEYFVLYQGDRQHGRRTREPPEIVTKSASLFQNRTKKRAVSKKSVSSRKRPVKSSREAPPDKQPARKKTKKSSSQQKILASQSGLSAVPLANDPVSSGRSSGVESHKHVSPQQVVPCKDKIEISSRESKRNVKPQSLNSLNFLPSSDRHQKGSGNSI